MGKPLTQDLRERVVAMVLGGASRREATMAASANLVIDR